MLPLELNVITLNIWGIPFVSSDRVTRVEAISDELSAGRYDIVSLQEVWSQKDCKLIQEKTAGVLPYSHYFYSGVIGAGLLVLSKYPIISTLFHAWSVNGYFHRIQHADWFGGKGVGLCRILVEDQVIHLYNAHLHAEYNNKNDEYKTHRIIQAFDTAQFIRATRSDSTLQILAGDLNTQPEDICYKMLLYTSKMRDCCLCDAIATNESQRNSYTSKRVLAKSGKGIRIDHIFIRNPEHIHTSVIRFVLPFTERVPGHKFSYSDHEAVLATLRLVKYDNSLVNETFFSDKTELIQRRANVLRDAIVLCDSSLHQLKYDRIIFYCAAILLSFFLIAITEYLALSGLNVLYTVLKFVLFGVILFFIFMGSLWNYMEHNAILSSKMDMEMMLRCTETFELGLSEQ